MAPERTTFRLEKCLQIACILLADFAARVRLSRSVDPRYSAREMRRLRPTGPLPQYTERIEVRHVSGGEGCLHFSSTFRLGAAQLG